MRYSMVIVDDEFYSRNGIAKLIDWGSFNIDIIGMAESGREGMELIGRLKPDIVLSDIRMNGMDGLDMIERLRSEGCKSRFVLISGYREFDYARKAIEQKVVSYLLKPVDKEELTNAINKVIQSILSEQETGIFSSMESDETALSRELERKSSKEIKSVCIVRDSSYFSFVAKLRLFKTLKSQIPDCIAAFRDDEYLVVLSKESAGYTAGRILECFSNTPMMGAAQIKTNMAEAYNEARIAMWSGIYKKTQRICFYDEIKGELSDVSSEELLDNETAGIIQALELANTERCKTYIDAAFIKIKDARLNPEELRRWLKKIITAIINITDKIRIPTHEYICSDSEKLFAEKVFTVDDIDEMQQLLAGIIDNLDRYMESKIRMNGGRGIKLIKMYIDEHYMEDISLKDLEKMFYTELSYLSKLFKKETGMNYLKYITEKRINKAKELLKNPELTVAQVADMLSYTDARYFGQLFKKVVGKTVSEYRNELNSQ